MKQPKDNERLGGGEATARGSDGGATEWRCSVPSERRSGDSVCEVERRSAGGICDD